RAARGHHGLGQRGGSAGGIVGVARVRGREAVAADRQAAHRQARLAGGVEGGAAQGRAAVGKGDGTGGGTAGPAHDRGERHHLAERGRVDITAQAGAAGGRRHRLGQRGRRAGGVVGVTGVRRGNRVAADRQAGDGQARVAGGVQGGAAQRRAPVREGHGAGGGAARAADRGGERHRLAIAGR